MNPYTLWKVFQVGLMKLLPFFGKDIPFSTKGCMLLGYAYQLLFVLVVNVD